MTLTELMRLLQDFGIFVVVILLAYVVYKVGILIDVISNKIKGEKDQPSHRERDAESTAQP